MKMMFRLSLRLVVLQTATGAFAAPENVKNPTPPTRVEDASKGHSGADRGCVNKPMTVVSPEARRGLSISPTPDIIADTMRRSSERQPDVFCSPKAL